MRVLANDRAKISWNISIYAKNQFNKPDFVLLQNEDKARFFIDVACSLHK